MQLNRQAFDGAGLKRLTLPFSELKLNDDGNGSFSGYASIFGNVDLGNDIVRKGAFVKAIPAFIDSGFIAWGHDWDGEPVAYPTLAREDDHGLYIEAGFHGTPKAQSARQIVTERLAAGKFMGLSIGYKVAPGGAEFHNGIRTITEMAWLPETSIVMAPMNQSAGVTGVKGGAQSQKALDGSFEEIAEEVRAQALAVLTPSLGMTETGMASSPSGYVVATFVGHAVLCVYAADGSNTYWDVPYTVDQSGGVNNGQVTIGTPTEVEMTYIPVGKASPAHDSNERFAAQLERVLLDLGAVKARANSILELRVKEGRQFSTAHVSKLTEIADGAIANGQAIHDLIAAAAPQKAIDPLDGLDLLRLRTDHERTMQRLRAKGVLVA